MIFCGYKKCRAQKIYPPPLLMLFLDPGSEMDKNEDPVSGINIPDPQHWS
jgi:hypothetical protein